MASNNPTNLVQKSIGQKVFIKCRNDRSIVGVLHAYDDHLNLLLSLVEETGPNEEGKDSETRKMPILYVRGDLIIGISPLGKRKMNAKNIRDELEKELII